MNLSQLIEQLESCGFTCEAGPLENNTAFIELKRMAAMRPESPVAKQWTGDNAAEISEWANGVASFPYRAPGARFMLTTPNETVEIKVGDWVVRDSSGNIFKCSDGLFQALSRPIAGDVYNLEYIDDKTVRLTKAE